jgi:hypothetical protein
MKVYVIGPNLRDQSKGQFHVHAAGCADVKRMARREPAYRDELEHGPVDLPTMEAVGRHMYDNGIMSEEETGLDYLSEFHFFPCCETMPLGGEPTKEELLQVVECLEELGRGGTVLECDGLEGALFHAAELVRKAVEAS